MANKLNLIGEQFGQLTVLQDSGKRTSNGTVLWLCQCSCGNTKEVTTVNLRRGSTKSCGCYRQQKASKDLTNQIFGRLTVLFPNGKTNDNRILWHCRCKCGQECDISSHSLISETTKSCGCLNTEVRQEWGASTAKDLANKKFGKLTAICPIDKRGSHGEIFWHCRCECGNEKDIVGTYLTNGNTQSCGCMVQSHGEFAIEQLLKINNIQYQSEYIDKECKLPTGGYARFDFKCIWQDIMYYIEFDGIMHYYTTNHGWNNQKHLEETQQRDLAKNIYCLVNGIPLIRIPYTHLKNLTIEDLMLPTSTFIVKGAFDQL